LCVSDELPGKSHVAAAVGERTHLQIACQLLRAIEPPMRPRPTGLVVTLCVLCCWDSASFPNGIAMERARAAPVLSGMRAPHPLMMPKGDGKKRRPKKQKETSKRQLHQLPQSPAAPFSPSPAAPSAARVRSDRQLSVRRQIALARAFKQMSKAPAKPASRTSFRKKTKGEAKASGSDDEVDADSLDLSLPTLFIDGYNVINAWPRLKKRFQRGELLVARQMLLEEVADFTIRRFETTVVFDANAAVGNIGKDRFDDYAGGLVRLAFAHDSADAFIERQVRSLQVAGKQVWVATNDGGVRIACSLHDATVVSANWLVNELKAARKASAASVTDYNNQQDRLAGRGSPIWDSLDASLRQDLDARINARARASLTRADREATDKIARQQARGELVDPGSAGRRQRLLAEQRSAKRRGPRK